jgi:ligand-binding SRPBCC domain-containing protein
MRTRTFETSLFLPVPRERVFAFFSDAHNLEEITPAFLRFHVVTPAPIAMRPGTIIDYKLRLHGVPIRWRSEITVFDPPCRFVDEQRRGPYRVWHHEHLFEESPGIDRGPPGTNVIDRVTYAHFGGDLVHRYLVRPSLERIFAFRKEKIRELLGAPSDPGAPGMLSPCGTSS